MDYLGFRILTERTDETINMLTEMQKQVAGDAAQWNAFGKILATVNSQKNELVRLLDRVRLEQHQRAEILKIIVDTGESHERRTNNETTGA